MFEKEAAMFCNAIRTFSENEDNLNNLESYLTYHFRVWIEKFANTPEGLSAELKLFAEME